MHEGEISWSGTAYAYCMMESVEETGKRVILAKPG